MLSRERASTWSAADERRLPPRAAEAGLQLDTAKLAVNTRTYREGYGVASPTYRGGYGVAGPTRPCHLVAYIIIIIKLDCRLGFTRWQWYYNKTQHTQ
jgi:hypothetical protein